MGYKKTVIYIGLGAAVVLAVVLGVKYEGQLQMQQEIAEKIVRFHVRANSDSKKDQQLKLAVRDAVGSMMGEKIKTASTRSECETIIRESLEEVALTAEEVIEEEGYAYSVTAQLGMVDFPVKTYGEYTFPAGTYEALEVVIGEGEGQNWWCVMYPNMCFSGSVYEVVEEDAKELLQRVLTPEEYREVFSEGNYEVQFKYLNFLNELTTENMD